MYDLFRQSMENAENEGRGGSKGQIKHDCVYMKLPVECMTLRWPRLNGPLNYRFSAAQCMGFVCLIGKDSKKNKKNNFKKKGKNRHGS